MKKLVVAFCAAVALSGLASAAEVYVATNGVDAVGRGTQEAPYATVQYAVASNPAPLTVYVAAGKYLVAKNTPITLNQPIQIIGDNRDTVNFHRSYGDGGGAIFKLNHTNAAVANLRLSVDNSAYSSDGILQVTSGTATNVLFKSCGGYYNGVLYLNGVNALAIDCEVISCKGWASGRLVRVDAGLIERIIIRDNFSGYGGITGFGLYINGVNAVVRNSLILRNNGASGATSSGTGVYITKGLLENSNVIGNYNSANGTVAGVNLDANAKVVNCIIISNTANKAVSDLGATRSPFSYCCSPSFVSLDQGNLSFNPLFANYATGDFSLLPTSPCVNAGTNVTSTLDLAKNPRNYNGSVPDIGCYEFQGDAELSPFAGVISIAGGVMGTNSLETSFSVVLAGVRGSNVSCDWDFGDGCTEEVVERVSGNLCVLSAVEHTYTVPGNFSVSVSCSDGTNTCFAEIAKCIFVDSSSLIRYVNAACATPSFPYDKPEIAAVYFGEVAVLKPAIIYVANGTYNIFTATLDWDVKIFGEDPEKTIFKRSNTGFNSIFKVNHTNALVAGVQVNGSTGDGGIPGGINLIAGTVSNVVVQACGANSGGAFLVNGAKAYAVDCVIRNGNMFNACRGALTVFNGLAERFLIKGNYNGYADVSGVGMEVGGANAIVRNCLVISNRADKVGSRNRGTGAYVSNGGTVENCTFYGNYANGGTNAGVYVASENVVIRNCIILSNRVTNAGYITRNIHGVNAAALARITYSCSPELVDGVNGNIVQDPRFEEVEGFPWAFRSASPCVGAGLNVDWMFASLDFVGKPRRVGRVDMGCFESQCTIGYLMIIR